MMNHVLLLATHNCKLVKTELQIPYKLNREEKIWSTTTSSDHGTTGNCTRPMPINSERNDCSSWEPPLHFAQQLSFPDARLHAAIFVRSLRTSTADKFSEHPIVQFEALGYPTTDIPKSAVLFVNLSRLARTGEPSDFNQRGNGITTLG